MGLETATYISDLVAANPTGADQKGQGDDHIRLIKQVLKNTFPNAGAAITLGLWAKKDSNFLSKTIDYTQVSTDNGKALRFDCTAAGRTYNLLPVSTAADGFVVFLSKTGNFTLTIDGSGAEQIEGNPTVVLQGEWSGYLVCDGTKWNLFGIKNVVGPTAGISVDHAPVLWDGISGKLVKSVASVGTIGMPFISQGNTDPLFSYATRRPFVAKTTDYTLLTSDLGQLMGLSGSVARSFTLPSPAACGNGAWFEFFNVATANLTIIHNAAEAIISNLITLSTIILSPGDRGILATDGTNWFFQGLRHFESTQQTITAGGALVLPHSLGVPPMFIHPRLYCIAGNSGYNIGDEIVCPLNQQTDGLSGTDHGLSLVPDSTNINLRYGAATQTFLITNKGTGVGSFITNSSWKLIVRAYVEN